MKRRTAIPVDVIDAVMARSGGRCEARIPGVCQGRATNLHHRRLRSQGGLNTASNILALCGTGSTGCHGHIHARPEWARERGFLLSAYHDERSA